MTNYQECEKLHTAKTELGSQEIGEFLDWLSSEGYYICKFYPEPDDEVPEGFYPERKSIEQWLADYFGIDLDKVEEERRQILKELRHEN